jgi:leucyl/phenylalanyl-tRNA---protein transferase
LTSSDGISPEQIKLTPEIILRAYAAGIFPMAESRDDADIFWVDPEIRGIFPLDGLHVSRSLKKRIRQNRYEIRYNSDFTRVIRGCAEANEERNETWINSEIIHLYTRLFYKGHAHTVECWQDDELVGGLYGISLKGAFFGESMFSRKSDASKVALVHLIARLIEDGFTLLDTQFVTDHLTSLGAIEIPRDNYLGQLDNALLVDANFNAHGAEETHQAQMEKLLSN